MTRRAGHAGPPPPPEPYRVARAEALAAARAAERERDRIREELTAPRIVERAYARARAELAAIAARSPAPEWRLARAQRLDGARVLADALEIELAGHPDYRPETIPCHTTADGRELPTAERLGVAAMAIRATLRGLTADGDATALYRDDAGGAAAARSIARHIGRWIVEPRIPRPPRAGL